MIKAKKLRVFGIKPLLRAALTMVTSAALAAVGDDWPVYLGDAAGSHYSKLDQINRENVTRLTPV